MKSYYDIVGDGGSRIMEQVGEQRGRIDANLAGVRTMLAVGSGKGGVGKSTLTMLLAAALAADGRRCAILDADLNGPSQARMAGLREVPFLPGAHGLALPRNDRGIGVISLGTVVPESEAVDFESVARGDTHVFRAIKEFTALGQLLSSVEWGALDTLLIDLPPGAERTFQFAEFLGRRCGFVLVTIPSDLARGVVARSIAALAKVDNPVLGYIENMSGYYCQDCDAVKPLFPASESIALGIPRLGSIPFDPALASICDRGQAPELDDNAASSRAIRETTARIAAALEKTA